MSIPKFSQGEVVILQSNTWPELNGQEFTVTNVVVLGDHLTKICRITGKELLYSPLKITGYFFDSPLPWPNDGFECMIGETALRKKHDGSSFSFSQLMSSLKQPSLIDN